MAIVLSLHEIIDEGQAVINHRPWSRTIIDRDAWEDATNLLGRQQCTLLGLWSEGNWVHLALINEAHARPAILTLACDGNHYPSVGRVHPPAIRLERAIADLSGLAAVGLPDTRPWLNHGTWPLCHPLAECPSPEDPQHIQEDYRFLPVEGESLHQVPVGPVHASIIEPGHFRFTASGETIVRLEERLGYAHKGIETLMSGRDAASAARLAGRVSGDSTLAYALAFCRALEAAYDINVPTRAVWLRALMAELERLANHLGDFGAICNDAAFVMLHAHCGLLREQVLRTANRCFGHRLMMDCIVPGGVAADLDTGAVAAIKDLLVRVRRHFPELVELYDNTASLQNRTVGTGILNGKLARQFGCGGYIGRASGRDFDARRMPGYAPYHEVEFEVPLLEEGDVNARVWLRIREVEQSLSIMDQILQKLPRGTLTTPLSSAGAGEGVALVEGFRGDILVWVKTNANGTISRCHLRDPSWFQWPVLEVVIEDNIVADFPLCNKSFNCSYSGHDL